MTSLRLPPFAPVAVMEIELTEPVPDFPDDAERRDYGGAWVLVRHQSEPLGVVRFGCDRGSDVAGLRDAIAQDLGPQLERRFGLGSADLRSLLAQGCPPTEEGIRFLEERDRALAHGPSISIVICTRGRADSLRRTIDSVAAQRYSRFEVIVVDNSSGDPSVATLARRTQHAVPIEYIVEPRVGLSRARNSGTQAASGDVVAFIDDDEAADAHWLAELASGYLVGDRVAAVNGAILPAELESQAQDWFEQYGGHSKGRGFAAQIFDPSQPGSQSPLYPLPAFGAGGNMSFRRDVLTEIGGFDPALGAGTRARGGEDTAAFTRVMLAGHSIVYRPSAFVWHRHYVDFDGIYRQLSAYGSGLTAYYVAMLRADPRLVLQLVKLFPRACRDMFGRDSLRTASIRADFPAELLRAHRRGLIRGPWAYVRGRREAAATARKG